MAIRDRQRAILQNRQRHSSTGSLLFHDEDFRQVSRFFAKQMANKAGVIHSRIHQAGPALMCPGPMYPEYSPPNVFMWGPQISLNATSRPTPTQLITFSALGGPGR